MSELQDALDRLERVEANLTKLRDIWSRIEALYPEGVAFGQDAERVDDLLERFDAVQRQLPPIDGRRLEVVPLEPDKVAHLYLHANEAGGIEALLWVGDQIDHPHREIEAYGRRLAAQRLRMVRSPMSEVVADIDFALRSAKIDVANHKATWMDGDRWSELSELAQRLAPLIAQLDLPPDSRLTHFQRHLRFAEPHDLRDIVELDWPSLRTAIDTAIYSGDEPLPVPDDDLAGLAQLNPQGSVTTALDWSILDPTSFEKLVFEIYRDTEGYENTNWYMATNAADRGRDIESYRVRADPLSPTIRERVIIQCKHWRSKSVAVGDIRDCLDSVQLWEPPKIDVVVIATSGRATTDAVQWKEKRDAERRVPAVVLLTESDLEHLVSKRRGLAARFGLR